MEVPHHGVRGPSSDELDGVRVDVATEQSHGSPCTQRSSADVRGCDSGSVEAMACRESQLFGDVDGADTDTSIAVVIRSKNHGFVEREAFTPEPSSVAENYAHCGFHGAAEDVMAAPMGDDIAAALVFLRREM